MIQVEKRNALTLYFNKLLKIKTVRIIVLFLLAAFNLCISINSFSQQSDEMIIRKLEDRERAAILKGDTTQLSSLMSKQIVVQNPENAIVGFQQIVDRVKSGKINYSRFDRRIDRIAFVNNIAVVMGLETLTPQGDTQNAGKTVTRRFTNIWTKESDEWKLTARQATVVLVK